MYNRRYVRKINSMTPPVFTDFSVRLRMGLGDSGNCSILGEIYLLVTTNGFGEPARLWQ
jgi:hypothetical protein